MESGAKGCEVLCHYVISQFSSLECDDEGLNLCYFFFYIDKKVRIFVDAFCKES